MTSTVIPDRLEIDQAIVSAITRRLWEALPYEGCGLLAAIDQGDARRAVRFFPGDNIDRSTTRFTMDPRQVFAAMESIEREGWRLGAIVHSHPNTEAVPSPTDLCEAFYPHAWLAIVSFARPSPELRVWDVAKRTEPCERIVTIVPA